MSGRFTNGSGLAEARGCERQWTCYVLARGDIPEAVRVSVGERTAWRIPVGAANRWLREQGVEPPEWVKAEGTPGRWEDVWVPKTG